MKFIKDKMKTHCPSFHFHGLFIYLQNIPSLCNKNSELLAILWEEKSLVRSI